jgi:hypothetical protein
MRGAEALTAIREHACDICDSRGAWADGWHWFGSMLDEEDGVVLKTCSDSCREKVISIGGPESALRGLREARGLPAYRKGERGRGSRKR